MNKKHLNFVNKIKDLEQEELITDDDFFHNVNVDAQTKEQVKQALADPYPVVAAAKKSAAQSQATDSEWFDEEDEVYDGQLALDVYQDKKNIYIKAAIAGVKAENIDINLNNDMITIKGKRNNCHDKMEDDDYYIKECYWGGFSRSIILPVDIKTDQVEAQIEDGLLTITLPKSNRPRNTKISVKKVKK